jgi:uncharacterized protein (DUF427 family)
MVGVRGQTPYLKRDDVEFYVLVKKGGTAEVTSCPFKGQEVFVFWI